MVLTDIIALSLLVVFALGAVYLTSAFIVYKFKNRNKINPHLKKTLIDKVSAVVDKPRQINMAAPQVINSYDNMNNVAGYINGRPVIYVQADGSEMVYKENILRQSNRRRQSHPKQHKIYQRHEIRFN